MIEKRPHPRSLSRREREESTTSTRGALPSPPATEGSAGLKRTGDEGKQSSKRNEQASTRHVLLYGSERIAYAVRRRPERRSGRVAIHVEPDGQVLVDAPVDASVQDIRTAVSARAHWIHTHVSEARQRLAQVTPREYVSGESWPYLGRRYRLKVMIEAGANPGVRLAGQLLVVKLARKGAATVRKILNAWYRRRARAVLTERLAVVAKPLRWVRSLPPLRLQAMRVQWGSCSPAGRLTLNPHLVKAPRQCIDYVLLHELCHLRDHNHGPGFYATLERHLPGWRSIKKQLDGFSEQLLNR